MTSSPGRRCRLALAIALLAAIGVAAAGAGAKAAPSCTIRYQRPAGSTTIRETDSGPASAVVRFKGRSYAIGHGCCVDNPSGRTSELHLGAVSGSPTRYVAVELQRPTMARDGSYSGATELDVSVPGSTASANRHDVRVTLRDGRTKGSFTVRTSGGDTISGTFDCGAWVSPKNVSVIPPPVPSRAAG